jgi:glycosyltransferase involved in cell wall biosynthesis
MARGLASHSVSDMSSTGSAIRPSLGRSSHPGARVDNGRPLRIAMLAPPWIAIPPPGYGGIETVVDVLCDELVRVGHDVTLFAAPGSRSSGTVHPLLSHAHPEAIGDAMYESDHVASAFAAVDQALRAGRPFDVVHDHSGFTALAMADRLSTPMVHTLHGPFIEKTTPFYEAHGHKAEIVAISRSQRRAAPPALAGVRVIPNPVDIDRCWFDDSKDDYLLWMGRMVECKGPHRAIRAARAAGRPLVIAGPIQPGQGDFFAAEIEPYLHPERCRYVGEIGGEVKQRLISRAAAMLVPIRWDEPFGMVMVEALAGGTPVIAFAEGAAREIVLHGENGFLVEDELDMARAVERLGEINPHVCRTSALARYDVRVVATAYEAAYRAAAARALAPSQVAHR